MCKNGATSTTVSTKDITERATVLEGSPVIRHTHQTSHQESVSGKNLVEKNVGTSVQIAI